MAEISNRTIAGLLIALIAISLISLFYTMIKLSGAGVTGYASSTGTGITNVTVAETTYINVTDNFIDLGVLEPGGTNNSEARSDWFDVQNDGSVNINISVYDTSGGMFSGTGCNSMPYSCYQVHGYSSDGSIDATYANVPAVPASQHLVCSDVPFVDSGDDCTIGVQVVVPVDEPAGAKQSTMTIVAEKA